MLNLFPNHRPQAFGHWLAALLLSAAPELWAGAIDKTNNTDALNLGSSWVGGVVPGSADTARWASTVTGANSVSLGADLIWNSLVISNAGGPVTIAGANTLSLNSTNTALDLGNATQDLTLGCNLALLTNQSWTVAAGRTLALSGALSGSGFTLSKNGSGAVVLSGGGTLATLDVNAGQVSLTGGTLSATGGSGAYGYLIVSGGAVFQQTGGTLSSPAYITIGQSGSGSLLDLRGGTCSAGAEFLVGYAANGSLTLSGSANASASNLRFGQSGTATVTLNGGTLSVKSWSAPTGGSLLLNGGTLRYSGSGGDTWGPLNNVTASVSTNGAVLNDNGQSFTLAQSLGHATALGGAADGGLTKQGGGTLVLSGTNSYTGPTLVASGKLQLTGRLNGSGTVTVRSGASLGGNGTLAGPLVAQDNASLQLTNGALSTGTLTLSSNALLNLGLTTTNTGAGAPLLVNGNLTLDGQLLVTDLGGLAAGNAYTAIYYTGTLTNNGLVSYASNQWNFALDTSTPHYVKVQLLGKFPLVEITNSNFVVSTTTTNLGGLVHGYSTLPLWYEVRDSTNRLWDYGSLVASSSWSITVRHLRPGTNTVTVFGQDSSGVIESNAVELAFLLGPNPPVRPRPQPAEIWWGGSCHDNLYDSSGNIIGTYSRMSQLMNTNLGWDFVKRYQDGFFLHGYVWVNQVARMTNWVQVGQSISSQLLPWNGKYWLEDSWRPQTNNMNEGHSSATGQAADADNLLSLGLALSEITQDFNPQWQDFSAWHPDWPTNNIRVLITGNTNQATAGYPYPSGQWRDYALDFRSARPNIKFGWTWSPVWFHWRTYASLGTDSGVFSITNNGATYSFNWDFSDFLSDAVAVGHQAQVPFAFASDCPWDYYGLYPGNPGGWSAARQAANRAKIRAYEAWLQGQQLRHTQICNYSQVNAADTNASDLTYETNSLNTMVLHQQEGGRAWRYAFESWYEGPYAVVPETQPGTYTHLALSAIKYLKGIRDTNGTREPLNLTLAAANGTVTQFRLQNNGDVTCLPALVAFPGTNAGLTTRYFTTNGLELTAPCQTAEGACFTNLLAPGAGTNLLAVTLAAGLPAPATENASLEAFWNPQDPLGIVHDRIFFTPSLTPLGSWQDADLGSVGLPGGAALSGNSFTLLGSGADIWGSADACHFLYQSVSGDGTMTAHLGSQSAADAWSKAGLMVRESSAPGARQAFICLTPRNGANFQNRLVSGGATYSSSLSGWTAPAWVRLVRSGTSFSAFVSSDGLSWTAVGGATNITGFATTALWGFAVTAHNNALGSVATFDQVTLPLNLPPVLSPLANQAVVGGATVNVTNAAYDPNTPPQRLLFSLLSGPTNALINPTNGLITWRPLVAQSGTSNLFTVVASQAGWLTNLWPLADAYVRDGTYSNLNFGTDTNLYVKLSTAVGAGQNREAYLKFALGSLPGTLASAQLQLHVRSVSIPGTHAVAPALNDTWTETGITWSNRPGSTASPLATWAPQAGATVTTSVLGAVQSAQSGDGLVSLRLYATNTTADGLVAYYSRENDPALAPLLAVTATNSSSLSVTQSFWLTVNAPLAPTLQSVGFSNGVFGFSVSGSAGPDYVIQTSTNLASPTNWVSVFTNPAPAVPFQWTDTNPSAPPQQFYRILLGP